MIQLFSFFFFSRSFFFHGSLCLFFTFYYSNAKTFFKRLELKHKKQVHR